MLNAYVCYTVIINKACGGDDKRTSMTHNCRCNNRHILAVSCRFLHAVTNINNFYGEKYNEYTKDVNLEEARKSSSELISILRSPDIGDTTGRLH
jgi:hypothetical protein